MKTTLILALVVAIGVGGCKPKSDESVAPVAAPPPPVAKAPSQPTPLPPPAVPTAKPGPRESTPATSAPAVLQKYQTLWNDEDGRAALITDLSAAAGEQIPRAEVAKTLSQLLKLETSTDLKVSLLEELGSVEDVAAIDPILSALDANQPAEVREAAADAADSLFSDLAFEGNKSVLDQLLRALDARYPTEVRESAIRAIEDLEDPRAIPHLEKLLNDPDQEIKDAAESAIDWLKPE